MLLASIIQSLFPFFPLVSDLLRHYRIDREIAADQEAIEELGNPIPVISVLKKLLFIPTISLATASAIADFDTLEPRIKALINNDRSYKTFSIKNAFISLLSLMVFAIIILSPIQVQAVTLQNQKNDSMMVCLQGNACATWCKEHNTVVPYSNNPMGNKSLLPNTLGLYTPAI